MSKQHRQFLYLIWFLFFVYLASKYAMGLGFFDAIKDLKNTLTAIEAPVETPVSAWDQAIELNERGLALQHTDVKLAEELYLKAIALEPGFYYAYNNLGILYINNDRKSEAFSQFTKAIEVKPDYDRAYNNLGAMYYESGSKDKALELYFKAISFGGNDPSPYDNVALILDIERGKTQEAIYYYKKALEYGSKNSAVISRAKELLNDKN